MIVGTIVAQAFIISVFVIQARTEITTSIFTDRVHGRKKPNSVKVKPVESEEIH